MRGNSRTVPMTDEIAEQHQLAFQHSRLRLKVLYPNRPAPSIVPFNKIVLELASMRALVKSLRGPSQDRSNAARRAFRQCGVYCLSSGSSISRTDKEARRTHQLLAQLVKKQANSARIGSVTGKGLQRFNA